MAGGLLLLLASPPPTLAMEDPQDSRGPEVEASAPITPPPDGPDLRPLIRAESFPYSFQGNLGNTGLKVVTTSSMLQVVAIEAGSPAALGDLPNPNRVGRVRLAAINGLAVEDLGRLVMLAAFHPSRKHVTLTFGRPTVGEKGETLVGPYELPLTVQGMAEQRADWLAAQQRFAEAVVHLMERNEDASVLASRLLLAARDAAAGEDWSRAHNLAAAVPPSHPLHAQAQTLKEMAFDRLQRQRLGQAEALSKQGLHQEALNLLQSLSEQGPLGSKIRSAISQSQRAWNEAQFLRHARSQATPSPVQVRPSPPLPSQQPSQPSNPRPSAATHIGPRAHGTPRPSLRAPRQPLPRPPRRPRPSH